VNSPNRRLTESEIGAIVERLRAGQPLDEQYRDALFGASREALLTYSQKESRGSVLASTMSVPLQVVRRFGDSQEWANKLIFGDNLQVLKRLLEDKQKGLIHNADGSPGVRLCYIDPPFSTQREFRGKKGQLAYRDRVADSEFVEFLRKRLIFIHELLSDDGSLYMHLDTKKVHYMKVLLDEIFGPQNFRSEIIWRRASAHNDTAQGVAQHGRIHDTLLFYTKSDKWVWNPVYTPYDDEYLASEYRHLCGSRRYKQTDLTGAKPGGDTSFNWNVRRKLGTSQWSADLTDEWKLPVEGWEYKPVAPYRGRYWAYSRDNLIEFERLGVLHYRSTGMPRLKQFADEMPGVSLQDMWTDINAIGASAGEREDYPTQKPSELAERVIRSSSGAGDICLDGFVGSGTTVVAAERLGRRWIGVDCGKLAIYTTQRRLLGLDGDAKIQPFDLCHAGLYDNRVVEGLTFGDFEKFALELFGCVAKPHKIAGVPMAGTRKGSPVHVFPFHETDGLLGDEYIETLHERIGSKAPGPVFVIVPAARCDLFGDVFSKDRSTYFVMQIPYSVIESLHERPFQLFAQPTSEDEVNDAIDSYGFEFVQPPEARLTIEREYGELQVCIEEFRRGGLDPEDFEDLPDTGRGDLAMVLVDPDYNGDDLRVTHSWFGQDLAQSTWTLAFSAKKDATIAVVMVDTHGNELRQILDLSTISARAS